LSTAFRKSSQDTHRGFGYVEFALAEDAHEAIDNMDQAELYGRVIKVNQAKPQKQAGEKLGSKTAVWEQVSFLSFSTAETDSGPGCCCLVARIYLLLHVDARVC
jgi:RNA recognition motif-containing protein